MIDLISLADCTRDEITGILDLADELKSVQRAGKIHHPLEGQTMAMIFEKPSLRTRVTFETGMFQLGGHALMIHSEKTRLGERESIPDVARNLDRWVDGIMARTFSHGAVIELAEHSSAPVINGLTDKFHPCQVLADAQTLREHRGSLEGLKVAFVGDGNNVCASWMHLAARVPINVTLVCPESYEVDDEVFSFAREQAEGEVAIVHDMAAGLNDADAVYTDVWASMGQESEANDRREKFEKFQVNGGAMKHAKDDALFMHCLPAHRGDEVTPEVIDGPQSIVFDQAENRLHAQKAVMVTLMQRGADGLCDKRRTRQKANAGV